MDPNQALRSMLADQIHHERLATAAALRRHSLPPVAPSLRRLVHRHLIRRLNRASQMANVYLRPLTQ